MREGEEVSKSRVLVVGAVTATIEKALLSLGDDVEVEYSDNVELTPGIHNESAPVLPVRDIIVHRKPDNPKRTRSGKASARVRGRWS